MLYAVELVTVAGEKKENGYERYIKGRDKRFFDVVEPEPDCKIWPPSGLEVREVNTNGKHEIIGDFFDTWYGRKYTLLGTGHFPKGIMICFKYLCREAAVSTLGAILDDDIEVVLRKSQYVLGFSFRTGVFQQILKTYQICTTVPKAGGSRVCNSNSWALEDL